jgi:hypothetical protein
LKNATSYVNICLYHEEYALKQGFTMNSSTLEKLNNLLIEGKRYEEVQKSAHHEIDFLEEET